MFGSILGRLRRLGKEKEADDAFERLRGSGKPVLVKFTANWCATCQVNKKRAYTPEVIALMQKRGIVALKADKTKPDPAIDQKLRELNRHDVAHAG